LLAGAFLPHRAPELHVGVPDIPRELLVVGLAQDRPLVGLREPGEHGDIAWHRDDAPDARRRKASEGHRIPRNFMWAYPIYRHTADNQDRC
jgi:hypothetical protein